jgi:hypothetical protein
MHVSSELPLAAENIPPALFAEGTDPVEGRFVEDEEFPSDLPLEYDRMLQRASRRTSRLALGLVVVIVAVTLIALSALLVHKQTRPSTSVLAPLSSSSDSPVGD